MNDATIAHGISSAQTGRLGRFLPLGPMPLFTYGTLLFPEVLHAIIGRVPQNQIASAEGWRVAVLKNRTYPGLVATPGEITHGRLLVGLSGDDWRLLDNFENRKYELQQITLIGGQNSLAYVWVDNAETCSNTWDFQNFALTHLPAYVERCAARHGRSHQFVCDLLGNLMHISDPLSGNTHDAKAIHATGLSEFLSDDNAIGDKGYLGTGIATPLRKPAGGEFLE